MVLAPWRSWPMSPTEPSERRESWLAGWLGVADAGQGTRIEPSRVRRRQRSARHPQAENDIVNRQNTSNSKRATLGKSAAIWACAIAWAVGMAVAPNARGDDAWVTFKGHDGPGMGKHVVLISGDEEYRSEETLPQLAKILSVRHGFDCTVLFAIDPATGTIDPDKRDNIPGLEALDQADLMVLFLRFRDLPDEQMAHVAKYVEAGKPIVALRTATHSFNIAEGKKFSNWTWTSTSWDGGFGRQILGETWISHHGDHGKQSTRGILADAAKKHPIFRGIADGDIWGPTDVYGVRSPLHGDCQPLLMGQVLEGMKKDDKPVAGEKNQPMMPIAWTKAYQAPGGKPGKAFVTTMGASQDFETEGTRRMLVNACYWGLGLEAEIAEKSNVELVGEFKTLPFKFGGFARGVKPSDHKL